MMAGTVDKVGGLDNYLLGNKMGRVKELGPMGWKLRNDIMATNSYKKRQSAERYALGIPKGAFDESPVVEEAAAEVGFEAEAEQPEGAPKVERDESGRYTL